MGLSTGDRLGPYEIIAPIGAGGMGDVYRARDTRLGRDVAVKVVRDQGPGFEKEPKALAALNHPNVVAIYDIGPDYVVMELVEGEPLRELLRRGPLPLADLVEFGSQVAEGLAAAHDAHLVHLDLKPENIMISRSRVPKILDFGIARRTGAAKQADATETVSSLIAGTVGYMSPEQVRGQDLDWRSDIFSLGLVLFEMCTGRRAFSAVSSAETMSAIANEPPSDFGSGVNPRLQALILRCLDKNRERRFQSGRDLAFTLRDLLTSQVDRPAAAATIDSLAVMPFENVGGNPDTEYLSDGITESLINSLSRVASLRVIARSRVFRYKGKEYEPVDAGRELNVRTLLTGRVSQRGDMLRVQAELVDTASGAQLWGERFHRKFTDIFEVEDEIAGQITSNLQIRLSGSERQAMEANYRKSSEAYQHYLRGLYHWKQRTVPTVLKAIECFEAAIAIDPNYAAAYEGLANCNIVLTYFTGPPMPLLQKAAAASDRAHALATEDGSILATKAAICVWLAWDWNSANAYFEKAIQLAPESSHVHDWAAFCNVAQGRTAEGLREIRAALEIDPLALHLLHHSAWFYLADRQFEAALEQTRKMIELDPAYPLAYYWRAKTLECLGRLGEAESSYRKLFGLIGRVPSWECEFVYCLGFMGKVEEARQLFDAVAEASREHYVDPWAIAIAHLGLGESDLALDRMEEALRIHSAYLSINQMTDVRLDPLRTHPRFVEILRSMGLSTAPRIDRARN